jgi:hypothetical protein
MTILLVALLILVALVLLLRPGQIDFGGLSELDLQRYITYAAKALADGGWVHVQVDGFNAPIGLKKNVLKRGSTLIVRVSSGEHSREAVQAVADSLKKENIEYRLTYSRKRRLPRWSDVEFQIDDPLMPSACTHVIKKMSQALGATGDKYTVTLGGPFASGFPPTDGEVIPHSKSTTLGFNLGFWVGSIVRLFRLRN